MKKIEKKSYDEAIAKFRKMGIPDEAIEYFESINSETIKDYYVANPDHLMILGKFAESKGKKIVINKNF